MKIKHYIKYASIPDEEDDQLIAVIECDIEDLQSIKDMVNEVNKKYDKNDKKLKCSSIYHDSLITDKITTCDFCGKDI